MKNIFKILTKFNKTLFTSFEKLLIKIFPKSFALFCTNIFRFTNGEFGEELRYNAYSKLVKSIGKNVKIASGVYIYYPEKLTIGNNVTIKELTFISAYGEIKIGNNVSIAHRCSIISSSHNYTVKNIPMRNASLIKLKVIINDNVWVGANVVILLGVSIGTGVVIGASSLVNKNVDNDLIVGGVPIKIIKKRI